MRSRADHDVPSAPHPAPHSALGTRAGLSRLDFLRLTTGWGAGWWFSASMPSALRASQTGNERQSRIARLIAEYDRQGFHRTGTAIDQRSGGWLLDLAKAAGADAASLHSFAFSRVDVASSFLQTGERRIEGLPLFDGTFTGSQGITGRLGLPDAFTDIALVRIDSEGISGEGRVLNALRTSGTVKAIVIVTEGAHPGLVPINAPSFRQPFGPPALQVGSEAWDWLEPLARRQAEITVVAHVERTPDSASNVRARVSGREPRQAPIVVITPRSGWWHCAAERGGGLACWIETIRSVRSAGASRSVEFLASSGHELGHLGLDRFIDEGPDLVRRAHAWVHLGANLGAAGGRSRLQSSDDEIEQRAVGALLRAGTKVDQRVPRGTVPAGEARNIHLGGGRYVSLLGSSPYFHNVADRYPVAVDVPAVAKYATAIADLVVTLASTSN